MTQITADACLARETLQRSKGDAKQSTLAFQQSTRPSSAASATITTSSKLQRSTTAAATTKKGQSSNKRVRRASSDSALLLPQQQSGQQQSEQRQPAAQAAPDSQHLTLPVKPWQPNLRPQGNPDHGVTDRSPINEQSPFSSPVKSASGPLKDVQNDDNVQLLSPKSAARQLDGSVLVQTSIVGRRFRTGVTCCQHTPVCLNRQPENIRDPNAIQVLDSTSKQVLGYLPRDIAQHLAGLLDTVSVEVTATVEEPKSIAAVVPITLQVCPYATPDWQVFSCQA